MKAVYKNPKSGKLYTFEAISTPKENGEVEIVTQFYNVYDNAKVWDSAEVKVDKKGKAYKCLSLESITLKNGVDAFKTIKE